MNREEIKQQLSTLRGVKRRGIEHHGYGFCDNPIYDEILELENKLLDELMVAEPVKMTEQKSRW